MLKIEAIEDIRTIKKGTIYDFSKIEKTKIVILCGENGCGKSTLLHALRGHKNDLENDSLYVSDYKELSRSFNIEHNFDKIIYMDGIKDNPLDINVGYDAIQFIENGGLHIKNKSHGQSTLSLIAKFMETIKVKTKPKEEKVLLVLDEIDKGLSLKIMSRFLNVLYKLMDDGFYVMCITHNPFVIQRNYMIYDFESNKFVSSSEYIEEKTGFIINKK